MAKPTVYFTNLRDDSDTPFGMLNRLLSKAQLGKHIEEGDLVAVKAHLGEEGNVRYVRPTYIRKIIDKIAQVGGNVFLTDTTALYPGARFTAANYLQTAAHNGFTNATVNAPVIIADGLRGFTGVDVPVKGQILSKVNVAEVFGEVDFMVVVSHLKLHEFAGFGGAIKNLGMGCVTKYTKAACHRYNRPFHLPKKCKHCGDCVDMCEYDCLEIKNKKLRFNRRKCMGCLACYFGCPHDAYKLPSNIMPNLQKGLADSAYGVTKLIGPENIIYINLLIDIVEFCDCAPMAGVPIMPDIGFLLSKDPVAVDSACIDLMEKDFSENAKKGRAGYHTEHWDYNKHLSQIEYAEKMNLGRGEYRLIEI